MGSLMIISLVKTGNSYKLVEGFSRYTAMTSYFDCDVYPDIDELIIAKETQIYPEGIKVLLKTKDTRTIL